MALPNSIAAAHFSRLAVSTNTTFAEPGVDGATYKTRFATAGATVVEIPDIRDMPQIGDPANIVNVPVYGQATTLSVGAQADAPSLELTLNYVPSKWVSGSNPGAFVQDGTSRLYQFAFLTAPVVGSAGAQITGVPNALFYFWGRIESLLVTPARDDAATATISLSLQSKFYGPYTV